MIGPRIIFIGFMGSGKSSVALAVSSLLGIPRFEMDEVILTRSGFRSVPEIFEQKGEPYFRALESEILEELAQIEVGIISTGGGIVGASENRAILARLGNHVVFLDAPFELLRERLANKSDRPLFRDVVAAAKLFELRMPLYKSAATVCIQTQGKSVEQVALEVTETL